MRRVGGLWVSKSKKDNKSYLKGSLTLNVLLFKAETKKNPKSPDYVVYVQDQPKVKVEFKSGNDYKAEEFF